MGSCRAWLQLSDDALTADSRGPHVQFPQCLGETDGRARSCLVRVGCYQIFGEPRRAEICDCEDDRISVVENILWLQVAMHDALKLRCFNAIKNYRSNLILFPRAAGTAE